LSISVPGRSLTRSLVVILGALAIGYATIRVTGMAVAPSVQTGQTLRIEHDEAAGILRVFRSGGGDPVVTQHARPDFRPYLHPIVAPDGRGVLTEDSPSHHPHQTGLYWGFTRLNGRDYFHNPGGDHWRRVSAGVLEAAGETVRWQTVYDLVDEAGEAVLTETQRWTMRERDGRFLLDLEWRGQARTDVTVARYDYGGLFLRMPWRQGVKGEVVNAARQRDGRAEGQRAMWIDVGMQVEGRDDLAHIAIFDHPDNAGYPQPWRVDGQLGVGPARSRLGDWRIPGGAAELVRHRLVVYTGDLDDVALTGAWSEFSGSAGTYATSALWGIARGEGRAAAFLSPDEAAESMTLLDGFTVAAWAGEPMIAQPMAFTWDDRGRLWVAENMDYENREEGFSNAGTSRIVILEDTTGDGKADSRTVFMEGIVFPAAIAVGLGGVFVGAPPNLLFIPDRDGDDRADEDAIEVRLTGWGIRDRHETLNSLHWGPDGWLYGLQGYATPSRVRKPEDGGRLYRKGDPFPEDILEGDGVEIDGGVWRYHPTRDIFEVVAHGFSNPWGIDHDAKGQLLISACVIPHLWHVVPGGIYHRQGGQHLNPYVYSDLQTIADHRHRSAHGGARVYLSDAFPASHHGRIFMANIHEHAVLSDVLVRRGSGFTAHHGDDFLLANNAQWIGFSLEIGPDGAIYVLDWHDADICGQDVLHPHTGRIFRIAPTASLAEAWPGRYADISKMPDAELVALQTSRSAWHARRARLTLQHRAGEGSLAGDTHDRLRRLFDEDANPDWRLRAMWALHVTGGWTAATLSEALADRDEHIRAWAVQLLTEDGMPSPRVLETFARLARTDPSPVVRLYLASALQRLDLPARWPIAGELLARGEDAGDHNLPIMVWLGVEPLVAPDPALALEHASRSAIPQVARFIARRSVDADAIDPVVAAIARRPAAEISLLEGLRDGLDGRYDVAPPDGWAALAAALGTGETRLAQLADEISRQFGDAETARRNLETVRSRTAPVDARRRALQVLAAQRRTQLVPELPALVADDGLRADAIRAMAAFDQPSFGELLVERYATFSSDERAEAVQTLATRRRYGLALTGAIARGVVPRGDVPPHVARQLLRVVGAGFTDVWGPVDRGAVEERVYARYRRLLNDQALAGANLQNGRAMYRQSCGACHTLYGEGGTLGPDITGSNRTNLEYLLFNVLEPSAEVQDAYKMVVVTTRDGRMYSGTVTNETDRQVTLTVVGGDPVIISKAEIQSREVTAVSMMPPGLFDALEEQDVIDLVAYLRTTGPID
jgi:putative membrane-bound dehydrogenase-like protein